MKIQLLAFALFAVPVAFGGRTVAYWPFGGQPASTGRVVRVACIGDSIASGYALKDPDRDSYPAQLGRMLGERCEVRNFGVPALGIYEHLRWGSQPRAWSKSSACAEALAWQPDIVISNLGINDMEEYPKETPNASGVAALAPGTFRDQYVALLNRIKGCGSSPRIIMWTHFGPLGPKHKYFGSTVPFDMEKDVQTVASIVGAEGIDMYKVLRPYVEREIPDGIHPSPVAARAIAEATFRLLCEPGTPKERQALAPLPLGSITARGWTRTMLERSRDGLAGHYGEMDPDQFEKPYQTRDFNAFLRGDSEKVGWCGEMAGQYRLAQIELAEALDDATLRGKFDAWRDAAFALQDSDEDGGYLGAYAKRHDRLEDYNPWSAHFVYRALLLEHSKTKDPRTLDAVHRGLLWFTREWSGDRKTSYASPAIIWPMVETYMLTGDRR